ncbi:MAG: AAA family ATPase [Candidatus Aenigmatarchaeota archaeon]
MAEGYQKWGWKENPFTLKIDPKLFTGYEEQVRASLKHIENKHKIALITGHTGSGKTTFLKWLRMNAHQHALYISKPPEKPDYFINIFTENFPLSFWERIFRKYPSLFNLPAYVNKKLKGNQLILLLDEAHETNREVLEWLRVLVDQIDNVSLIIAGMPILEEKLKEIETLNQRITTRISLISLNQEDVRDLIQKRIADVGGRGTVPFTVQALDKIYQRTGGFPREVIKLCDKLVSRALENKRDMIDEFDIEELREIPEKKVRVEEPVVTFSPKPPSEEKLRDLPYKQRKIIDLLSRRDWLTPTAIVEELEMKGYKSKGHAIRSVNNILKRMMLEGFVQREARGKAYMYALTPKVKTLFVES